MRDFSNIAPILFMHGNFKSEMAVKCDPKVFDIITRNN